MNKKIIDWLLEGPAWLRYAVELQLLNSKPDIAPVLQDSSIKRIAARLKDDQVGIPALRTRKTTCERTGNAYWDLFFLADIGLTASDLKLNREIEEILSLQSPDGTFITERIMESDSFCVSGIIMSSVAKMDYRDDRRLGKFIQVLMNTKRTDGGWHCSGIFSVGHGLNSTEDCPMDNLNVLMLLGQYEKYRKDPGFNGALDLLLEHWERRDEKWRLDGFGTGRRFRSLQYPAPLYGILRVIDVLSLFPYAIKSQGFESMLDFIHQKSSGGKYFAESPAHSYAEFDFGQDKEPSRWVTFLINRIEKRAGEHK